MNRPYQRLKEAFWDHLVHEYGDDAEMTPERMAEAVAEWAAAKTKLEEISGL